MYSLWKLRTLCYVVAVIQWHHNNFFFQRTIGYGIVVKGTTKIKYRISAGKSKVEPTVKHSHNHVNDAHYII